MYDFYTELNLFWENYGRKSDSLDWIGELQKYLKTMIFSCNFNFDLEIDNLLLGDNLSQLLQPCTLHIAATRSSRKCLPGRNVKNNFYSPGP